MDQILENYAEILHRVNLACERSSRKAEEVGIIVVTKHQPVDRMLRVWEAGARCFGENYPEETALKIQQLPERIQPEWHMIGHIQSRKIKYLVEHFSWVHSIDRLEIALKLNQAFGSVQKRISALIEINISSESTKFGYSVNNEEEISVLLEDIERMKSLNALEFRGIMIMPPLTSNAETNRVHFQTARQMQERISRSLNMPRFDQISMGTSSDFEVAIEEGATFVRIGEAILGKRN
ncbi:MAG: YggS family pyridoxal phosphate-dependent enzyme [Anaerolineaceae bacterium]|nr:YggS family pyridoxal phosphate-dependent enzyme [Anaerolineaceae bacterium]